MNNLEQWQRNNEEYLAKALTWLRLRLERQISDRTKSQPVSTESNKSSSLSTLFTRRNLNEPTEPKTTVSETEIVNAAEVMAEKGTTNFPPALILLSQRFGLSQFEQQVLLLCAAMELDTRIANLCAQVQNNPRLAYPTFALALSLFDEPAWDVLSPERPLRYWRLIEINQPGAQPLTTSALRADERIVNYIKGLNYLDDRLNTWVMPLKTAILDLELPSSQQEIEEKIVSYLQQVNSQQNPLVVQLLGADSSSKQLIAERIAERLGLLLYRLPLELLPSQASELETFARLWQRESILLPIALYLDAQETEGGEGQGAQLNRFLSRSQGLVFLSSREVRSNLGWSTIALDIDKPTPLEQRQIWETLLADRMTDSPARLASQFNFNLAMIEQIARSTLLDDLGSDESTLGDRLWNACLTSARPRMDFLAQRLQPKATWDDLVLPAEEIDLLRQIAEQVRQRSIVYEDWGFNKRMNRGLGISALFAGGSGTGKTMAAEVIANDLRLNLYRIDLSAVVSKYIGETEKNLRRLFDAAEDGGAILFFDEADALFGKRSEIKDSHDRYANIEINYLLQRMEAYKGLAILASNMKSALDNAFMRRLRFILNFPFPGSVERQAIWQRAFPQETPRSGLDFAFLSRLNLTGGSIHNIALNAAFLAAQAGTPVTMSSILSAARSEFRKLDRPVNEADFRWQEPVGVKL
jgi:hypothetical protein